MFSETITLEIDEKTNIRQIKEMILFSIRKRVHSSVLSLDFVAMWSPTTVILVQNLRKTLFLTTADDDEEHRCAVSVYELVNSEGIRYLSPIVWPKHSILAVEVLKQSKVHFRKQSGLQLPFLLPYYSRLYCISYKVGCTNELSGY